MLFGMLISGPKRAAGAGEGEGRGAAGSRVIGAFLGWVVDPSLLGWGLWLDVSLLSQDIGDGGTLGAETTPGGFFSCHYPQILHLLQRGHCRAGFAGGRGPPRDRLRPLTWAVGPELVPLWGSPRLAPTLRRVQAAQKPTQLLGQGHGRSLEWCWDRDSGGAAMGTDGGTETPAEN